MIVYSVVMVRTINGNPVEGTRCVGIFTKKPSAQYFVRKNTLDISDDGHYNLAVIERVEMDMLYPLETEGSWYKYDKKTETYKLIRKPAKLEGICSFGIG